MEKRIENRLMQMTYDSSAQVRAAAATAFGEGGYKTYEITDRLLQLSDDSSAEVRSAAAIALARIGKK
jgi:HEAT repeat protein